MHSDSRMLRTALVFCVLQTSLCANILGLFFIPFVSHQSVYHSISRELSLKGHNVTVFTPNPINDKRLTNLTEIDIQYMNIDMSETLSNNNYLINIILGVMQLNGKIIEEYIIKSKEIFNDNTTFDLILVETLHPLVYAFGCRFKVPIIGISSLEVWLYNYDDVGNPSHPILSSDLMYNLKDNDFYQRVSVVLYHLWFRVLYYWHLLPKYDRITKRYFGQECSYLGDIQKNVSLLLINTNPILHPVRPNVPAVIQLGQVHLVPTKPLPQDLQNYLDQSPQGVVYFSLGSHLRSTDLSEYVREIIVSAMSELPYNFIWKWEADVLPNQPKNVITKKWLSQQDLLGHKNLKVFVTQGGLQSVEEAIMNGVPLVAMPFYVDQPLNSRTIEKLGIGLKIDQATLTKDQFKEMITEVAENNKYKDKIKEIRNLLVDQPMTGLEKAVWWIEYTIRHKGATHLRSPAADMSFFEYFLLDVIAGVFIFISIFICMTCFTFKLLKRLLRKHKNPKVKQP